MANSAEIGQLFEDIDRDHNGFITRTTLTGYVKKHPELPETTVDKGTMSGLGVMENVASEFEAIDTDFNGFITRDEMEDYVKKTGQDLRVVDDWFLWFDMEGSGKITYEEMCITLGIAMTKTYTEKVEQKREMIRRGKIPPPKDMPTTAPMPHPGLLDDVNVLYSGKSEPGLLEAIVTTVKENVHKYKVGEESKIAHLLKEELEKLWGRHWQVLVSNTTFGCAVGHENNFFIHFKYKQYLYILYRTTD